MTYEIKSKIIRADLKKESSFERKQLRLLRKKVAIEFALKNISVWYTLLDVHFKAMDEDSVVFEDFETSYGTSYVISKAEFETYDNQLKSILVTNVFLNWVLQLTFLTIYFKLLKVCGVDIKGK